MCWAAAASNVLAWGRWGTSTYNSSCGIFTQFQDHWTDNGGYAWWGYQWWINGSPPPFRSSTASYIDVPGGGNFYSQLNFSNYSVGGSTGNLLSSIDQLMHQGYGVALNISNGGTYLHVITCWGFEYDNSGDSVLYQGIFVTDSDDGQTGLVEYPLIWQNDRWYLGGTYAGWQVGSFSGLKIRELYAPTPESHTPLPPSWVLIGTGLVALLARRRRLKGIGG
jgi:hypothetical protein